VKSDGYGSERVDTGGNGYYHQSPAYERRW